MNSNSYSVELIDEGLDRLRTLLDAQFFARSEAVFTEIGDYAAAVMALLVLAMAVVSGVYTNSIVTAAQGALLIIPIAALHYAGRKFLPKCSDLVARNPSSIGTAELMQVLAAITVIMAVAFLCVQTLSAFQTWMPGPWTLASTVNWVARSVAAIVPGTLALVYLSTFYLNSELISTSASEQTSPAQTALSVLAMFIKSATKMAPIVFGCLVAVGALQMFGAVIHALKSGYATGLAGIENVLGGLAYPFVIYLAACFFYIFVDVCRAILTRLNA